MYKPILALAFIATIVLPGESQNSLEPFLSSNLPILMINTEDNVTIPDEPKIKASIRVLSKEDGEANSIADKPAFEGSMGIELRGNSTQRFPKKPYNFEIRDDAGEDMNIELLGMPEESDWVLRASYLDHTFIRNPLAMHMSRSMGRWASRCRLVEVVLNDEYQGIYILMEKIKRDKNRVDINKLKEDEISGSDLTGGYIYEVSGQGQNFGKSRELKYPKIEDVAAEQLAYITEYDDNFRAIMKSADFDDPTIGYSSVIDVASFVDELLVQEAIRNSDAYGWSSYFHKEKEEKLKAGPVWDFDQSSGNSSYPDNGIVEGWMFQHQQTGNTPSFWPKLFEDPHFAYQVRERWESLREGSFKTEVLISYIDSIATLLSQAQEREFAQWPVLGVDVWRETSGFKQRDTYTKEVEYLKQFLIARWEWIDAELANISNPDVTTDLFEWEQDNQIELFPNPTTSVINIKLDDRYQSPKNSIQILNVQMAEILNHNLSHYAIGNNTFQIPVAGLPSGVYLYRIINESSLVAAGKMLKVNN